jgi:hypothetical protein
VKRWQIILITVLALYAVAVIIGVVLYTSGDEAEPIDTRTTVTATQP